MYLADLEHLLHCPHKLAKIAKLHSLGVGRPTIYDFVDNTITSVEPNKKIIALNRRIRYD